MQYSYVDEVESALRNAGRHAFCAERACRRWEEGEEEPEHVGNAAELAIRAAQGAMAELGDDGLPAAGGDHQSRRGRLACAAWLLLLSGSDEAGTSDDLQKAGALFLRAADA